MRFDSNVFYHGLEVYPVDRMLDEWRQTVKLYDQTGFTGVWIGEHHFWHSGYHVAAPSPVQVCTHLASITDNLRVAQSACILPDYHPIRLAEELAMLDQMTKGRLDVGVARGTNSPACIQFNIDADRRNKERNYALFKETLDIMIKAWTQDALVHEGEFYTFPVPGWTEKDPRIYTGDTAHYGPNGELIGLGVVPKPYQKPHPPIYQAADSTESYIFAAERGISLTGFGRTLQGLKEAWTAYRDTASRVSGREIPMGQTARGDTLNIMRMFYIADTMEEAIEDARDGINAHYEVTFGLSRNWGRSGAIAKGEEITAEQMNMEWFEFAMDKDVILVGTPETVAEKIERLRTEVNCQHVTLWPNPSYVPFKKVYRSLELFAERVIPYFEKKESPALQVAG